MSKFKLLLAFFLFVGLSVKCQTTDSSFIGKWKFKEIYNSEIEDSASLKFLRNMFSNMTMYFKANKHYKSFLFKSEEGEWDFNENLRRLTLTANKGTQSQLEILSITKHILIASFAKNKSVILERAEVNPSDTIEEFTNKFLLISASADKICKKWYLSKREVPGRTEEQSKLVTELVGETYFNFKTNNTYETQAFEVKVDGIWKFGADNKSLILTIESTSIIWKIKNITETELVLMRGNTAETWTFSTKPK